MKPANGWETNCLELSKRLSQFNLKRASWGRLRIRQVEHAAFAGQDVNLVRKRGLERSGLRDSHRDGNCDCVDAHRVALDGWRLVPPVHRP